MGSVSAIKINAEWPTIQPAAVPVKPDAPLTEDEREAKTKEAWSSFNDTVTAHHEHVASSEEKAGQKAGAEYDYEVAHGRQMQDDNAKMMNDQKRADREATQTHNKKDDSDDATIPKEGQTSKSEAWAGSIPDAIIDHSKVSPAADISGVPKPKAEKWESNLPAP